MRSKTIIKKRILNGILFIVLLLVGLTMMLPFLWTLSASFKLNKDVLAYPVQWIPKQFNFDNYIQVWTEIPFGRYFLNTLKLSVIVTIGQLITCSMASYAFAKIDFPGRNKLFLCYLATLMVPWHAIMIPQFIIIKSMGFYNTHWAIIFIQLFSAFGVFLMRQFMMGIPDELCEAARIDGAGEAKIFGSIIMPLCKPGLSTLTIFTFNFMWNDYMAPMIYLDDDKLKTIQLGLATFSSQYNTQYNLIMAGTVCSMIPMIVIFCIGQKYLLQGLSFSGLKG